MSKVKRNKKSQPKTLKKQFTPKKRKKRNAKRANNKKQPTLSNIKRMVINDCLKSDLRTRLVHKYNLANTNTTSAIVTIKNNTNSSKRTNKRSSLNARSISSSSSDVVIVEDSFSEVRNQSKCKEVSASDVIVLDDSRIENTSDSEAIIVDESNSEDQSESGNFDDSVIIVSVTNANNSSPNTNKSREKNHSNNNLAIKNPPKQQTNFVRNVPETSNFSRNIPLTVTNASQFGTSCSTPILARNSSLLCPTNVPGPAWQEPVTVAQQLQISVRNNLCPSFVSPEDANIVSNLLGSNFYNAGPVQKQGLRVIVIDGSNVAMG